MKRKNVRPFVMVVLSVLFLCGIGFFIFFLQEPKEVSPQENRRLSAPSQLPGTSFLDGSFQKTIDGILTDQFLYRIELVNAKKKMDYRLTQWLQSAGASQNEVDGNRSSALLTPLSQGRYRVGDSSYLVYYPILKNELMQERILDRVWQMNHLAERYPHISFYIYRPLQAQETLLFDEANGISSMGYHYNTMAQSVSAIPFKMLQVKDLEQYKEYFYASDHHWNYRGSYVGYTEILAMLKEGEEPLLPQDVKCLPEDYVFYGSHANATGRILPGERFCAYTFSYPEISAFEMESGREIKIHTVNDYFENYQKSEDEYYYNQAYSTFGERVRFHNDKGEGSLLLIGDSYSGAVIQLLAAHYRDIYLVRCQETFEKFDYIGFLDRHEIDQVLFMYTIENYEHTGVYEPYTIEFKEGQ